MISKEKTIPSLRSFKQLKASSVLESVIAITIISICALVAFSVYLNVIMQHKSVNYYDAKHKIEVLVREALQNKDYEDNLYIYKGYKIDKIVTINELEYTALLVFTIKTSNRNYIVKKIIPYDLQ